MPSTSRQRQHSLPHPLVVSLTSFPPRFESLAPTLRSLLRQSIRADHTVLWIAHSDAALLPANVLKLQKHGLEIRYADDTKSYKKILPALDIFPSAFICTADDDIHYWPNWLEVLVNEVNDSGLVVPCHRAHEITFNANGTVEPYHRWQKETGVEADPQILFPTGGGGVLYPPGILRHTSEDLRAALELCPHSDDVWLFWIAKRNGANFKNLANGRNLLYWPIADIQNLWSENLHGAGNDIAIQRLTEKYGFPTGH